MKVMRSCFYIPGNSEKMVSRAADMAADIITLDLEDSVPPAEKPKARDLIRENLAAAGSGGAEVYCRINNWETLLTNDDLEAVVHPGLHGVVLSKCAGVENVRRLDWKLDELEHRRGLAPGSIAIQLLIETAVGVVNAFPSAVASPRVNSLIFGALDYTKDMRVLISAEGTELAYARSHTAVAARAAGCVAIDYPYAQFKDLEGFERNTLEGRALGYEGRMLIHPSQIEPSHRLYSPSADQVAWARGVVEAFEAEGLAKGLAAISYQGKMVDTPVYESARGILEVMGAIQRKDQTRERASIGGLH
jgi:citrate lyase subunit beta/citryl-CoA lyase